MNFEVNGHQYEQAYFLADGIYPNWPVLVKTIHNPQDDAGKYFAKCQEAARKDIERTFGVLQCCWKIISYPSQHWSVEKVQKIMQCCIILHNMRVVDRSEHDPFISQVMRTTDTQVRSNHHDPTLTNTITSFYQNHRNLRDSQKHSQLMEDLKILNWMRHGLTQQQH